MDLDQILKSMTPEVYDSLCRAVETGRWDNGQPLTERQKEDSLQLVMYYQAKKEQSGEHFTIGADGELVLKPKSELKRQFASDQDDILRSKA